jgi:hypothetical protein
VKVKPSFLAIAADMAAYPTIGPQPISSARPESSLCNRRRIELNDASVEYRARLLKFFPYSVERSALSKTLKQATGSIFVSTMFPY